MSIWTHVAAVIRVDGIAALDGSPPDLGKTCTFESPEADWEACDVPCGSEGSLDWSLHTSPHESNRLGGGMTDVARDRRGLHGKSLPASGGRVERHCVKGSPYSLALLSGRAGGDHRSSVSSGRLAARCEGDETRTDSGKSPWWSNGRRTRGADGALSARHVDGGVRGTGRNPGQAVRDRGAVQSRHYSDVAADRRRQCALSAVPVERVGGGLLERQLNSGPLGARLAATPSERATGISSTQASAIVCEPNLGELPIVIDPVPRCCGLHAVSLTRRDLVVFQARPQGPGLAFSPLRATRGVTPSQPTHRWPATVARAGNPQGRQHEERETFEGKSKTEGRQGARDERPWSQIGLCAKDQRRLSAEQPVPEPVGGFHASRGVSIVWNSGDRPRSKSSILTGRMASNVGVADRIILAEPGVAVMKSSRSRILESLAGPGTVEKPAAPVSMVGNRGACSAKSRSVTAGLRLAGDSVHKSLGGCERFETRAMSCKPETFPAQSDGATAGACRPGLQLAALLPAIAEP